MDFSSIFTAVSRLVSRSWAPAMVWWPPPPKLSKINWTLSCPRERAEMFTWLPWEKRTKEARTSEISNSSSAAWADTTRMSGMSSGDLAMAQLL